jgi:rRNA-processing protein FCF1
MPYLLDGNNLIGFVRHTARPSEEDRSALVGEIAARLRTTRARASIFFDGPATGRATTLGSLTVRSEGGSADDAIVREIERSKAPAEMVVVTADRGLARRAREAGAKVSAPEDFFARFGSAASSAAAGTAGGKVDVDEWLKYFEDERNRE